MRMIPAKIVVPIKNSVASLPSTSVMPLAITAKASKKARSDCQSPFSAENRKVLELYCHVVSVKAQGAYKNVFLPRTVEGRVGEEEGRCDKLLGDSDHDRRGCCKCQVVQTHHPALIQGLAREQVRKCKLSGVKTGLMTRGIPRTDSRTAKCSCTRRIRQPWRCDGRPARRARAAVFAEI